MKSLLALPSEIILSILRELPIPDLGRMEILCKQLRTLILDTYQISYGPGPVHRAMSPIDYRALVIEQCQTQVKPGTRYTNAGDFLDEFYGYFDEELNLHAQHGLLILQKAPNRETLPWKEAVATLLMAQRRQTEALVYYEPLVNDGYALPEYAILLAARWGWPSSLPPLPRVTSRQLLETACIGAAIGGNEKMLRELQSEYAIPWDIVVNHSTLACAAAGAGQVGILQLLHENNVPLARPVGRYHALNEAARHNQLAAAQFLLDCGARPDEPEHESAAWTAANQGHIAILRLFQQRQPGCCSALASGDHSVIDTVIRWGLVEVMKFFIEEVGLDANERDAFGRTALHLAMEYGQMQVAEALLAHGADITVDASGQTAFERAVSHGNTIPNTFAQPSNQLPAQLQQQKTHLVRMILQTERKILMEKAIHSSTRSSRELEELWLEEERKWVQLWVRDFL